MDNNKKTKIRYFLLGAVAAFVAAALLFTVFLRIPPLLAVQDPTDINALKKVREIKHYIDRYYVEDTDDKKLADYMYLGLVTGLEDPYSTYYTKSDYELIYRSQHGEYKGIGVTITSGDGQLLITAVTDGGPSQRAGLKIGDQILTVNGIDYSQATSTEVATYIRGLNEDSLEITIYRAETKEELSFTVALEILEDSSVSHSMAEDGIGYIRVTSFTTNTPKQFSEAREDLQAQNMKALIVDLRGNPGGLVSSVNDVLKSFMPEGLLFYTEDKYGKGEKFYSEGSNVLDLPIAVLVDENTASASEIFSGAVQDHEVGTLIGTVTFGKGIVQNSYTLSDGSVLKITASHYYTPSGKDIHGSGITPDIEIENSQTEDLQFNKALEILREQISD